MDTRYYFQIESTAVKATIHEIEEIVPKWAKEKGKDLKALIYKNHKWDVYKTFSN